MTTKFRLLPTADVATLGSRHYLFDRAALHENVIFIPSQRVSRRMFDVVTRLKAQWPQHEPQTYEDVAALFSLPGERAALEQLAGAGYLEAMPLATGANDGGDGSPRQGTQAPAFRDTPAVAYFRERVVKHFFKRPAFFHLPMQIDDTECDVGLIGLPVSSALISSGTVNAPHRLRQNSQRAGFWFDLYKHGIYTETGCDNSAPRLLCAGVGLKDFGDIGADCRTVGDLFALVAELIETRLLPNRVRPIFVGGDHAITFPIVDCYLRHYPDLVLIHLDAHNDLFYTEQVEFNHAGPIHALLAHSELGKVLSFGLRTSGDTRVGPYQRLRESGLLEDRVHLYSINALVRWLDRPDDFRAHLREQLPAGAPCYLTIDLDVLSPECLVGQLSTPAGAGISWFQLLEMIGLVMDECDVLGCDVVEFNPDHKDAPGDDPRELTVLLLELIDGLFRRRARALPVAVDQTVSSPASAAGQTAIATQAAPRVPVAVRESGHTLDIDRRDVASLDYGTFLTEYVIPGRPLLITGLGAGWPALSRWSIEYFLAAMDRDEVVEVTRFERANEFATAREKSQSARETLTMMLERRARGIAAHDARYYIVNWQFADTCAKLLGDYEVPSFFATNLNEHVLGQTNSLRWLFIGEPGTGSPTHTDVLNSSAWLMLVSGRKQWRMVAAEERAACGRFGAWADLFAPDHDRFNQLAGVTLYEAEQLPGEVLWTPPLCVHAVRNLEHSIAVTQNYVDLTNLIEVYDALVSGPLAIATPLVRGDLLAKMVGRGIADLQQQGQVAAAQPIIAHLNGTFATRLARNTEHTLGIEAALRVLRPWSR